MQVSAGDAVPVQLRFYMISGLHQGYFSRAKGVRRLGKGLGACTDQPMTVDVMWSNDDLEGRILALMPEPAGPCAPKRTASGIDVAPLVPMTKALAAWRTYVAGTSDLRIDAFKVGVQFGEHGQGCVLIAGGQHPADGTTFLPCVEVGGDKVCATGTAGTSLTFEDAGAADRVATCLNAR